MDDTRSASLDTAGENVNGSLHSHTSNPEKEAILLNVPDDYDPITTPPDHHPLDFLPLALRCWYLILALVFFVACEAGTVVLIILSRTSPQRFEHRDETQRKLYQYSPMLVGTLTSLWWLSIVRTYRRILPYMAMAAVPIGADRSRKRVDALNNIAVARWSFGDLWKSRDWTTLVVEITQRLIIFFLIPSKAAFIQAESTDEGWTIQISLIFGCTAAGLYFMLIIGIVSLLIKLYHLTTGLKWDPASLASQLTLLTYLDPHDFFTGMEYGAWHVDEKTRRQLQRQLRLLGLQDYGALRLGYWRHSKSGCVVHGIRILPHNHADATPKCSRSRPDPAVLQDFQTRSVQLQLIDHESPNPIVGPTPCGGESALILVTASQVRTSLVTMTGTIDPPLEAPLNKANGIIQSPEHAQFTPLLMVISDHFLLAIEVFGVALLVVSTYFLARQKIQQKITLQPLVAALVDSPLETDVGNVLSFFLALMFGFFNMTFAVTDLYCRSMQPVRGLKEANFADQNILLDYISADPATIIIRAVDNGHWRVLFQFVLLSLCQAAPIFAGHVFVRKRQGLARSLVVDPSNSYTSYGIMILYVLTIPFMRIPANYRAPHRLETAIDLLPYVYHSHLAQLPEFVSNNINDKESHINAQVVLARHRYKFGLYLCERGRRHMGIAVSNIWSSRGSIRQPVDKVVVDSEWHRFGLYFFRPPRIEPAPFPNRGSQGKEKTNNPPGAGDGEAVHPIAKNDLHEEAPFPEMAGRQHATGPLDEVKPPQTPAQLVRPRTAPPRSQMTGDTTSGPRPPIPPQALNEMGLA